MTNNRRQLRWALGAFAVAAIATPAFAHHSAAMFDATRTVDVRGEVKSWLWTNPHSLLIVVGHDAAAHEVNYSFEANGPGYLVRTGWKRQSLKPGDAVVVTANPMRDGTPGGNLIAVTFPDGRKLLTRIPRAPAGAPAAPAAATPAAGTAQ